MNVVSSPFYSTDLKEPKGMPLLRTALPYVQLHSLLYEMMREVLGDGEIISIRPPIIIIDDTAVITLLLELIIPNINAFFNVSAF